MFDGKLPSVKSLTISQSPEFREKFSALGLQLANVTHLEMVSSGTFCASLENFSSLVSLELMANSTCGLNFLPGNRNLANVIVARVDLSPLDLSDLALSAETIRWLTFKGVSAPEFRKTSFPALSEFHLESYSATQLPNPWKRVAPHLKLFDLAPAPSLASNPLDTAEFSESLTEFA